MIRAPGRFTALVIAVLSTAGLARAQEEAPTVVPIVLRPALAPVPALKYRLLPERHTLVPGNAAIFYHRAVEMSLEVQRSSPPRGGKDQADFPDGTDDWRLAQRPELGNPARTGASMAGSELPCVA